MKRNYCGFDFGTTNSAIGICTPTGLLDLVKLEANSSIVPSALFFDYETNHFSYGQGAKDKYLNGEEGRLLMSLKSILGSDTITGKTHINGIEFSFYDIIGYIFKNIKQKAELKNQQELTKVVVGRPVFFNENNPEKDQRAQVVVKEIAKRQGFKDIEFQFEPIAAALAFESTIQKEQIALIVDIGGGTSDFSIIRLFPNNKNNDRTEDILANSGIYIGGNIFDKLISIKNVMPYFGKNTSYKSSTNQDLEIPSSFFNDFATWHRINHLYQDSEIEFIKSVLHTSSDKRLVGRLYDALEYELGHIISGLVEAGKIQISEKAETTLDFSILKDAFNVKVNYAQMVENISEKTHQIRDIVIEVIKTAGTANSKINTIFFTGGSTKIGALRELIIDLAPNAQVVEGDAFGSVAMGLTIDAKSRFAM